MSKLLSKKRKFHDKSGFIISLVFLLIYITIIGVFVNFKRILKGIESAYKFYDIYMKFAGSYDDSDSVIGILSEKLRFFHFFKDFKTFLYNKNFINDMSISREEMVKILGYKYILASEVFVSITAGIAAFYLIFLVSCILTGKYFPLLYIPALFFISLFIDKKKFSITDEFILIVVLLAMVLYIMYETDTVASFLLKRISFSLIKSYVFDVCIFTVLLFSFLFHTIILSELWIKNSIRRVLLCTVFTGIYVLGVYLFLAVFIVFKSSYFFFDMTKFHGNNIFLTLIQALINTFYNLGTVSLYLFFIFTIRYWDVSHIAIRYIFRDGNNAFFFVVSVLFMFIFLPILFLYTVLLSLNSSILILDSLVSKNLKSLFILYNTLHESHFSIIYLLKEPEFFTLLLSCVVLSISVGISFIQYRFTVLKLDNMLFSKFGHSFEKSFVHIFFYSFAVMLFFTCYYTLTYTYLLADDVIDNEYRQALER